MIQIDSLEIEIKTSSEKATAKVDRLKSSLDGLRSTIRQTSAGIATVRAPRGLERVAAQLENQRKILGKLKAEYRATVDALGADSAKSLGIEKKVYAAQDAMDRLNSKKYKMEYGYADELAAGIDRAVLKFNQLAEARERAAALGRSTVSIDYDIGHQAERIQRLNAEFAEVTGRAHEAAAPIQEAAQRIRETGAAADIASKSTRKLSNRLGSLIKRILLYRVVRGLLTSITNGLKEGFQEIYKYSQAVGMPLAGAMDSLKTDVTYLRNSIVASLAPLVQALAPVFNFIVSGLTRIIDLATQMFAALSGKSTYTRAVRGAVDFADATASAAGSAKEMKKQLMGFDELTVLTENDASGGGGGAGTDAGQMFEEASIPAWITDTIAKIETAWSRVKETIQAVADVVIPKLKAAWEGFVELIQPLTDWLGTVFTSVWNDMISPALAYIADEVIPAIVETATNLWNNVLVPVAEFIGSVLAPVIQIVSDVLTFLWNDAIVPLADAIGGVLSAAWEGLVSIINKTVIPILFYFISIVTVLWNNLLKPIANFLWDVFSPAFSSVFQSIGEIFEGVGRILTGLIEFVTGVFTLNWGKAWQGVVDIFGGIWDTLKAVVLAPVNAILGIVEALVNKVIDAWNILKGTINSLNIQMPAWLGSGVIGFDLPMSGYISIPRLEKGGFPTAGQLFIANEAGPELVGNMGGHTAVANNDQIVEGIEQGVYRAVMAAVSNSNGNGQRIELFVDGKKMADTVTRYQRQTARAFG